MEKKHYRIRYDVESSTRDVAFYDVKSSDGIESHGYITNYLHRPVNYRFQDCTRGLNGSTLDEDLPF